MTDAKPYEDYAKAYAKGVRAAAAGVARAAATAHSRTMRDGVSDAFMAGYYAEQRKRRLEAEEESSR